MDRDRAIYILISQSEKQEILAKVATEIGYNVLAREYETISEALRYAIGVLQAGQKEAE